MTICYFGDYDPNYSRNRVLLKGLKENGVRILECHTDKNGWRKYWDLYQKHHQYKNQYDVLLVGQSFRSRLVWLAKLLSRKKIIWDAFYSFYDRYVFDRQVIKPNSLPAYYYWLIEWLACQLADLILLDTDEHIKYFVSQFKISQDKFEKVLVGTDIEKADFEEEEKEDKGKFLIHFHGKYIPLQGIKYIIKAAKILESQPEIGFNLIGKGQTYAVDRKLADDLNLKNINFLDYLPFEQLIKKMNQADICLGIFGDTPKTQRVIPNKVYEAIAIKKPVISADTPAIQELFTDRENILLCRAADPEDLASKILELKNNFNLRENIARGAYQIFIEKCQPKLVVKNLLDELKK